MQRFDIGCAFSLTWEIGKESFLNCLGHVVMAGVGFIAIITVFSFVFFGGWSVLSVMGSQPAGLFNDATSVLGVILFVLVAFLPFIAAQMSIFRSTSTFESIEFPQAFLYGYGASIPVAVAVFAIYLLFALPLGVLFTLFGLAAYAGDLDSLSTAGGLMIGFVFVIFLLFLFPLALFVVSRLGLAGPIMAARGSYNPFSAMAESWRQTQGMTLILMLYNFIANLLVSAIYYAVSLLGTIMDVVGGGLFSLILTLPAYICYFIGTTLIPVGIFRTLNADRDSQELEETFG
ncbi:hypothetical protein [Alterisphingorhabdus coralli]|uniref:Glycerophosphoryl diester phosphodiesterase membrane domain-containing protein n=1 Tax=Alterisphingorhabdus coralli TaxID=3071408 RepID=A0AA97F694_9SPHN|nr:hypothetical protein [Parasphingorhabdus sp. SCSIO 66989]WOE75129.1 hypothetical protein RB602_15070 [Parasphingorhabdus sp. SCSIO 66989]